MIQLKQYLDLVDRMRRTQKSYEKSKDYSQLQTARALEKQVDQQTHALKKQIK